MTGARPGRAEVGALAVVLALLGGVGCGVPDRTPAVARPGAIQAPFAVSNFFTPSGYMGDGEQLGNLEVDVLNGRCMPRPTGAVGDCYRFEYHMGAKAWAGVYWVYPANNWGSRAGRSIAGTQFKEVRVQAASDTPDVAVTFFVGGIEDSTKPFGDSFRKADIARLGPDWQTIRFDVSGKDFDHLIGAFGWSLAYPKDWDGQKPVVLYFDDIVWDTESTAAPSP
jgi:hypothetical protein